MFVPVERGKFYGDVDERKVYIPPYLLKAYALVRLGARGLAIPHLKKDVISSTFSPSFAVSSRYSPQWVLKWEVLSRTEAIKRMREHGMIPMTVSNGGTYYTLTRMAFSDTNNSMPIRLWVEAEYLQKALDLIVDRHYEDKYFPEDRNRKISQSNPFGAFSENRPSRLLKEITAQQVVEDNLLYGKAKSRLQYIREQASLIEKFSVNQPRYPLPDFPCFPSEEPKDMFKNMCIPASMGIFPDETPVLHSIIQPESHRRYLEFTSRELGAFPNTISIAPSFYADDPVNPRKIDWREISVVPDFPILTIKPKDKKE